MSTRRYGVCLLLNLNNRFEKISLNLFFRVNNFHLLWLDKNISTTKKKANYGTFITSVRTF